MTWTSKAPTKPGYYWHCNPATDDGPRLLLLIDLREDGNLCESYTAIRVNQWRGEWWDERLKPPSRRDRG